MDLSAYLVSVMSLLGVALVVFQVVVKRAYLRRGRLGVEVGVLQALVWAPFFTFPYLYNPPDCTGTRSMNRWNIPGCRRGLNDRRNSVMAAAGMAALLR